MMQSKTMPLANINEQVVTLRNTDKALLLLDAITEHIELSKTTEEANDLRTQLEVVNAFLKRKIPGAGMKRSDKYKIGYDMNKAYLRASVKAGELWDIVENKRSPGRPSKTVRNTTINILEAGFRDHHDVANCVKASRLHKEDQRTYFEECLNETKMPTLSGMVNTWNLLNPEDPEPLTFQDYLRTAIGAVNALYDYCDLDQTELIEKALDNLEALKA